MTTDRRDDVTLSFDARCVHGDLRHGERGSDGRGLGEIRDGDRDARRDREIDGIQGGASIPASPPIVTASAFRLPDLESIERAEGGAPGLWAYSRIANPTVDGFERALAAIEGAEAAVATASGMGAITATLLELLKPGDRLVTTDALYGTTRRLIDERLAPLGIVIEHLPQSDLLAGGALPPDTRVLYTEAISNPLLRVADVPALATLARGVGAVLVVDATFATPVHADPLGQGADIVIHSASKYLGGHSDLITGVVAGAASTITPIRKAVSMLGTNASPFDTWLARRGLRTLHLRVARQSANAAAVADWLAERGRTIQVLYPGRADHPDHGIASRVLRDGFGGMVTFELAAGAAGVAGQGEGGDGRAAVSRFLTGLRMIGLVPSLAGVETTVSHPTTTSHRGMTAEALARAGISDGMVRLSCGVESIDDILEDLGRGLDSIARDE